MRWQWIPGFMLLIMPLAIATKYAIFRLNRFRFPQSCSRCFFPLLPTMACCPECGKPKNSLGGNKTPRLAEVLRALFVLFACVSSGIAGMILIDSRPLRFLPDDLLIRLYVNGPTSNLYRTIDNSVLTSELQSRCTTDSETIALLWQIIEERARRNDLVFAGPSDGESTRIFLNTKWIAFLPFGARVSFVAGGNNDSDWSRYSNSALAQLHGVAENVVSDECFLAIKNDQIEQTVTMQVRIQVRENNSERIIATKINTDFVGASISCSDQDAARLSGSLSASRARMLLRSEPEVIMNLLPADVGSINIIKTDIALTDDDGEIASGSSHLNLLNWDPAEPCLWKIVLTPTNNIWRQRIGARRNLKLIFVSNSKLISDRNISGIYWSGTATVPVGSVIELQER